MATDKMSSKCSSNRDKYEFFRLLSSNSVARYKVRILQQWIGGDASTQSPERNVGDTHLAQWLGQRYNTFLYLVG